MAVPEHIAVLANNISPGKHHLAEGLLVGARGFARFVISGDRECNLRPFELDKGFDLLNRLGADGHGDQSLALIFFLKIAQVGQTQIIDPAEGAKHQDIDIGPGLDLHRVALEPFLDRQLRRGVAEIVGQAGNGNQTGYQARKQKGEFINHRRSVFWRIGG